MGLVLLAYIFLFPQVHAHDGHDSDHASICQGGGVEFVSSVYPLTYLFEDFRKTCICKVRIETEHLVDTYNQNKTAIDALINDVKDLILAKELEELKQCIPLKNLLEKFVIIRQQTDEKSQKVHELMIQNLKANGAGLNLQQESNNAAWVSAMCTASHVGARDKVYWDLVQKLLAMEQQGVGTAGSSPCGQNNVRCGRQRYSTASRDTHDFAHDFGGQVPLDDIEVRYNTHTEADVVQISMGSKILFKSKCMATEGEKIATLTTFHQSLDKIEVRIIPNCLRPSPKKSNWTVLVTWAPKHVSLNPCTPFLQKLIEATKKSLESSFDILGVYWRQALCYELVYNNVKENLALANLLSIVIQSGNGTVITPIALVAPTAAPLPSADPVEIKLAKVPQDDNSLHDFNVPLFEFDENIDFYCSLKPSDKESIFKRVSWAYCHYGFKRLSLFKK